MEHFANTSDWSNLSHIYARCGWTISPLLENTLSTGADLEEQQEFSRTSIQGAQIPSGYKCLQPTESIGQGLESQAKAKDMDFGLNLRSKAKAKD